MARKFLTQWIDRILRKPLRLTLEVPERLLKTYVEPGMTVLDVGCGEGLYSIGMARLVGPSGRVIAVDTQVEAIEALKQRTAHFDLSATIEPRVCADRDLGVDDGAGQVDFALAVYVLHHAADPACLISGIHRALKPKGVLLVVEPRHHASPAECEAIEAAAHEAGFATTEYPKMWRDWAVRFEKCPLSANA